MEKAQIDKKQFFVLLILYILSNDLITGIIGGQLKQDFWVAQIISAILSVGIFSMYLKMIKNMNYPMFTDMIKQLVGKKIGILLLLLYSLYFMFLASLHLRDISELNHTYYLDGAPLLLLTIIFMIPIFFSLYSGIETTARFANLILFFTYFTFITFSLMVLFFNKIDLLNFLPILDIEFQTLIRPTLLMSFAGPFGELFVMLIVIQHIKDKKGLFKTSASAQFFATLNIVLIIGYCIVIIGGDMIPFILTPSMRISKKIDVENFIQRFDMFTLMSLIYLTYIKLTILLYGSKVCIETIYKKIKPIYIILVLCVATIYLSVYLVRDYIYFLQFREHFAIPYIKGTFEVGIPTLLFLLSFIRKPKKEHNTNEADNDTNDVKKQDSAMKSPINERKGKKLFTFNKR